MVSPRQKRRNRNAKQGTRPTIREHLESGRAPKPEAPTEPVGLAPWEEGPSLIPMTTQILHAGATSRKHGGWGRQQLAILGVPWPLERGWREELLTKSFTQAKIDEFLGLRTTRRPKSAKRMYAEEVRLAKKSAKLDSELDLEYQSIVQEEEDPRVRRAMERA